MNFDSKKILGLAVLISVILVAAFGLMNFNSNQVNCEEQYNQSIETGETDNIPEECRPVPEDVENQILMRALGS